MCKRYSVIPACLYTHTHIHLRYTRCRGCTDGDALQFRLLAAGMFFFRYVSAYSLPLIYYLTSFSAFTMMMCLHSRLQSQSDEYATAL